MTYGELTTVHKMQCALFKITCPLGCGNVSASFSDASDHKVRCAYGTMAPCESCGSTERGHDCVMEI